MNVLNSDAIYMNNDKTSIKLTIRGNEMILSQGDCIKFTSDYGNDDKTKFIGKILNFPYSGPGGQPNRIMVSVWRGNRWASGAGKTIGLRGGYVGQDAILVDSIDKADCPNAVGGKRRSTKKARRSRRRHTRKH